MPETSYRLPSDTRLGRVILQVSDLARSISYYTGVLGFRSVSSTQGAASLSPQDEDVVVIELREKRGVAQVPHHGRLGLYHYAILLPDRAALGRFVAHLARLNVRAGASDHFVSEALYLRDPDGIGIEVYADRPRSAWRYRDGEMEMTTKPLDLPDLVRAAGGEQWKGMPKGTRIGHVHLHVADLRDAAAFYQGGLGFDTTVSSYPGALFLSAGGYHHHLGTNTWAGDAPRAGDDEARLLEWTVVVPDAVDASAVADNLRASGYVAEKTDEGFTAVDPWGIPLRVVAKPRE
jgi:catechol 2,3-dioxygenase